MTERQTSVATGQCFGAAPGAASLELPALRAALRHALRHLHQLHRLAQSPLVAGLTCSAPSERGQRHAHVLILREALLHAIAELGAQEATQAWQRALHHTYVVPAGSQFKAAERARMSYGTYRRCVALGLAELAARWQIRASCEPQPS